ncbi:MAG: transposase [Patescibacteria group bacterium]
MRKISFSEKELYHIYNRGVDKRTIFKNRVDLDRFLTGIKQFNTREVIGSLGRGHGVSTKAKLVNLIAYCINQNHFHFILEPVSEKGIERFMHKLGMGYSKYFNTKYKRSGALFQGSFKAKHIDSNEYLLHLSAYINLNHMAHSRGHGVSTLSKTSWSEYTKENSSGDICDKKIILEQFKNKKKYEKFAEESLKSIIERKILLEELDEAGIELIQTT